jgi:uracil-DNA glycosylase
MESNIKFSRKVKILPWIGENYFNEKQKILILGMSTYYKDAPSKKDCINDLVKSICNGDRRRGTVYWTKIENLLINKKENPEKFWNRISYYSYIQEIMDRPKQKTPEEYWENAKEPFIEILKKLMPDKVIVMGYELFQNLPDKLEKEKSIEKNGKELKIASYFIKKKTIQKNIIFLGICHPSRIGNKYDDWKNLLKEYYKKERRDWAELVKILKEAGKFVVDV